MPLIYVVDDESNIRRLARLALTDNGMQVQTFSDGEEFLRVLQYTQPDCVLLDWMMPQLDGLQILRMIRQNPKTQSMPVIMLTAKSDEMDKVIGLEIGADDYITKPFGVKELPARVRAILRRKSRAEQAEDIEVIENGNLVIDQKRRKLTKRGEEIELTTREFDLLFMLMQHPGQVFSRDMLLDRVWKTNYYGDTRTVDVHIRYIRQKIEDDPSSPVYIETVRGVGYTFREAKGVTTT